MKNPAFILTNTLVESLRLPCLLVLLAGTFHQAYARESTVSVQLTVPDGGWKIRIDQVYQTPTHLLAVSKLERSPAPAIQVISQAKDSVKVKAPKLPVRHYVLGKTWNWPNQEPYSFLSVPWRLAGWPASWPADQPDAKAQKQILSGLHMEIHHGAPFPNLS